MNTKKIFEAGSCLVVAAGFFIAPVLAAKDDGASNNSGIHTLSPVSDWSLTAKRDRCTLIRNFGADGDDMQLTLDQGGKDATFNLTMVGDALRDTRGSVISVRFGPGQEAFGRYYTTATAASGRPAIVLFGAGFTGPARQDDGAYEMAALDAEMLDQIHYLQIERAGLTAFRLDFGASLKPVMARMEECTGALAGRLRVADEGLSKGPEPKSDLGDWVTPRDYPRALLVRGVEGLISFRLTVNREGKPTFCAIESSTMPQLFDGAVCLALLKNAEFEPARDWEGKPAESYWSYAVRFGVRR